MKISGGSGCLMELESQRTHAPYPCQWRRLRPAWPVARALAARQQHLAARQQALLQRRDEELKSLISGRAIHRQRVLVKHENLRVWA